MQGSDLPQILTNVHTKLSAALYSPKTQGRIPEAGANPPFSERMHYLPFSTARWELQGTRQPFPRLWEGAGNALPDFSQHRVQAETFPCSCSPQCEEEQRVGHGRSFKTLQEQFWAVRDGVEVAAPSFFVHFLLLHCIPAVTHLKRRLGAGRISVSPAQPSLSRFSVCSLIKTFAMK